MDYESILIFRLRVNPVGDHVAIPAQEETQRAAHEEKCSRVRRMRLRVYKSSHSRFSVNLRKMRDNAQSMI